MTNITKEEMEIYTDLQGKVKSRVQEIGKLLNNIHRTKYPYGSYFTRYEIGTNVTLVTESKDYDESGYIGDINHYLTFPAEYLHMTNEEILEHRKLNLVVSK
jgi:hypothetical protein